MIKARGRPAGLSPHKKQEIVTAAGALFFERGYKKVSIDEICNKAGVSRVTYYKHFADKSALALFVIRGVHEELRQKITHIAHEAVPFREKFLRIKRVNREFQDRLGTQFMADIAGLAPDAELAVGIVQLTSDTQTQIEDFFRIGQRDGAIGKHLSMAFILYMLKTFDGAFFSEELAQIIPDPIARADALTDFLFYGAHHCAEQSDGASPR